MKSNCKAELSPRMIAIFLAWAHSHNAEPRLVPYTRDPVLSFDVGVESAFSRRGR